MRPSSRPRARSATDSACSSRAPWLASASRAAPWSARS